MTKDELELIAFDMTSMGVSTVEDIMEYGYNEKEALAIKEELSKRG